MGLSLSGAGGGVFGSEPTARQREVLALLAQGRGHREVGEALNICANPLGIHVSRFPDKRGVTGRMQAVLPAIRKGLVHME